MRRSFYAILGFVICVLGCEPQRTQNPMSESLDFIRTHARLTESPLDVALLSVHQISPTEAFIVGGGIGPSSGIIFHFKDNELHPETVPEGPALWWIWGDRSGSMWACGDGGRILRRVAPNQWVAETTPLDEKTILYGLWGDNDGHIFAVGGSYRLGGEQNIILTSSGDGIWTRLEIEAPPEPYTYFKVWGHNPTWVVGDLGWALRITETNTEYTQTDLGEVLFTVHGHNEDVLTVGGHTNGQMYGLRGSNMIRQQLPTVAALNGLYVRSDGRRVAVGEGGLVVMSSNDSQWAHTYIFSQALEGRTIHGMSSIDTSIMVGGDLRRMTQGFVITIPSFSHGEQVGQ